MNRREVVWAPLGDDRSLVRPAPHPGIILEIDDEEGVALVFAGTGTLRPDLPHITVKRGTREAFALKLEKDTHFYPSNCRAFDLTVLRTRPGRCPPGLHAELSDLAATHLRAFLDRR